MAVTKEELIDALGNILAFSISRREAARNRVIGFTSEEEFDQYFENKYLHKNILNLGGFWLCSTIENNRPTDTPVIWGLLNIEEYPASLVGGLINPLLKLAPKGESVFVVTPTDIVNWQYNQNENPRIIPRYTIKQYSDLGGEVAIVNESHDIDLFLSQFSLKDPIPDVNNHNWSALIREKLNAYSLDSLLVLYADRYIIDYELTHRRINGIPTDIDRITWNSSTETLTFLEIKEKDPSKGKRIKGFGIDNARLRDINFISERTGTPYNYIVRHVKDQNTREFVGWKYTSFKDFNDPNIADCRYSFKGGRGMLPNDADRMTTILCKGKFRSF